MVDRAQVVIVGAGPCGLVAACGLRRRGVSVRVLDAEPGPARGSRAIMLWPPALDVLGRLGLLAEVEKRALRPASLSYHTGPGRAVRVRLGGQDAPLILPQEQTNGLLEAELARLGCQVDRPVRVGTVARGDGGVTVVGERADGTEVRVAADWLIGADGAYSTVREQLGVSFEGERLPLTFLLFEGRVQGEVDRSSVHYYLNPSGVLLIAPLPGGTVRISTPVPDGEPAPTAQTVQRLLDERGPGGLRVTELTQLTTFSVQERIADPMRLDRCFLIGDAAHVHSPVGGQGLNLGLQDAENLAWKLGGVIEGRLADPILQTYQPERRAAAEQIVATTRRMTRQAVLSPAAIRVRNMLMHLLEAVGALDRWYGPTLAGRRIRYPDVLFGAPVADGRRRRTPRGLPAAGTRLPFEAGRSTLDDGTFRLLTVGPSGSALANRARAVADMHPELVVHARAEGRCEGFTLVRPDGYVAASGAATDLPDVERALTALLAPARHGTGVPEIAAQDARPA